MVSARRFRRSASNRGCRTTKGVDMGCVSWSSRSGLRGRRRRPLLGQPSGRHLARLTRPPRMCGTPSFDQWHRSAASGSASRQHPHQTDLCQSRRLRRRSFQRGQSNTARILLQTISVGFDQAQRTVLLRRTHVDDITGTCLSHRNSGNHDKHKLDPQHQISLHRL